MQRTRKVALVSALVAAAVLIGAFALAAYRREVVAEAEEHEHEFMDHGHGAPAMHDSLPAGASAERRESRPEADVPGTSPPPGEPQVQPEPAHDHAGHEHHDH